MREEFFLLNFLLLKIFYFFILGKIIISKHLISEIFKYFEPFGQIEVENINIPSISTKLTQRIILNFVSLAYANDKRDAQFKSSSEKDRAPH